MDRIRTQWPTYVKRYAGIKKHNYAMSGATCSSAVTPRMGMFPGVRDAEITGFLADKDFKNLDGTSFLDLPASTTVYSIWIGTNDLGAGGFLTNEQAPGKTINDYVDCVFSSLDSLYQAGGRKFIIMNAVPLDQAPVYATPKGQGADQFWNNKPPKEEDRLSAAAKLKDMVATVNAAFKSKAEDAVKMSKRYTGADLAIFDTHKLVCIQEHTIDTQHNNVLTITSSLILPITHRST
jgi:hypothetical protein